MLMLLLLLKRLTSCLHLGNSSCSQRLVFRSIGPGVCWMTWMQTWNQRSLSALSSQTSPVTIQTCSSRVYWVSNSILAEHSLPTWMSIEQHVYSTPLITSMPSIYEHVLHSSTSVKFVSEICLFSARFARYLAWCQPILCGLCFHFVIPENWREMPPKLTQRTIGGNWPICGRKQNAESVLTLP